ncbi:hypothetical protein [Pasteurella testudinis]|uniref:hypothetical protein n=1 Tax=Pasteurella testudinis TaxID=761 RepID=UPI004058E955
MLVFKNPFLAFLFHQVLSPSTQAEIRTRIKEQNYSCSRVVNANLVKITKKQQISCYFSFVHNKPVITAFQFGRSALLYDDTQMETILSAIEYLLKHGLSRDDFF